MAPQVDDRSLTLDVSILGREYRVACKESERDELLQAVQFLDRRMREIDRRIRFLVRRLDRAEVVDPLARRDADTADQIFFGATVTVSNMRGEERTVSIVGVDEIDTARGYVSWVSPMARALIKAREGDMVTLNTPGGVEQLEILHVRYEPLVTG